MLSKYETLKKMEEDNHQDYQLCIHKLHCACQQWREDVYQRKRAMHC